MILKELLKNIYRGELPESFVKRDILSISCDSRDITAGGLFVAIPGPSVDGADFIRDAVNKGAVVVVVGKTAKGAVPGKICVLKVADAKEFWKKAVERFYGDPSQKVKTIGITGTNGKTTITYLLESILRQAGERCGVVGTVSHRVGSKIIPAKNTTPGLLENQRYLSDLAQEGIKYCAMEVSSHALEQGRVDLIDFAAAVFTNLTGDHLDYHKNMENYFKAKSLLFTRLSKRSTAVINGDDEYGQRLIALTKSKIFTYGINSQVDVSAASLKLTLAGSTFTLKSPSGHISIKTRLIGRHNIYNILAAAAACLSQNISLENIRAGVAKLDFVPGRLEQMNCGQDFHVYVDYAHTEDALTNVLSSLKGVNNAKVILVFGCGGNRDTTKRPKMGRAASDLADWSIITSDNPRDEDPQSIVDQITAGFKKDNYQVVLDREEAIRKALSLARAGDIVLVAGKGHEDYQIFKDKRIHFDDREVVREYFQCSPSKRS